MMRLDAEMANDMAAADEDRLIHAFENYIAAENPNVVILEDYNKGVLTENHYHPRPTMLFPHHLRRGSTWL